MKPIIGHPQYLIFSDGTVIRVKDKKKIKPTIGRRNEYRMQHGVYKHGDNKNRKAPTEANIDKRHEKSTSAGGEKMGETEHWHEFVSPETGDVMNTTIKFGESWDGIIEEKAEQAN